MLEITVRGPVSTYPGGESIAYRTVNSQVRFFVSHGSSSHVVVDPDQFPAHLSDFPFRGRKLRDIACAFSYGQQSVFSGPEIAACSVAQLGEGDGEGDLVGCALLWFRDEPELTLACVFEIPGDGTDVVLADEFELSIEPVPPKERTLIDRITRAPTHRVVIKGPIRLLAPGGSTRSSGR